MSTGYAIVENAVNSGAEEYVSRPFTDEKRFNAVKRSLDKLQARRVASQRSVATPRVPLGVIGESEVMKQAYRTVAKAARATATVLISGESGTEKRLVARERFNTRIYTRK
jgi:DNA-binding NtrC family response regulator